MTDRPMLFSAPMIRALLAGTKTQTRRVLKPQIKYGFKPWQDEVSGDWFQSGYGEAGDDFLRGVRWAVGDQLWVRENFAGISGGAIYRADGERQPGACCGCLWRPSIHMPRWASRLTLTVTDVRVQRLQEISREDALAEGCTGGHGPGYDAAQHQYMCLWNAINGAGAWDANPWVVALSFSVERRNIDA